MILLNNPDRNKWSEVLKRPSQNFSEIENLVKDIFKDVQANDDFAILKYTKLFDGISINEIVTSKQEIVEATNSVSKELKEAIEIAKNNIEKFHLSQKSEKKLVETSKGALCWQEKRPIQKIGLYIPGGTAPLFSTILMLAIPAKIADCEEIILCTPPDKFGKINPTILYTANLCGITKIMKVGGIQAIAGMSFGTKSIPKIHKIFGPGNQYVTMAKQIATQHGIAIDMPAGPSELLIIADESAIPSFVAADLLSQAEHGMDSQVILVSTSQTVLDEVTIAINNQIKMLPRKEIAKKAMENSKLIFVPNNNIAIDLINEYAPEHFIICTKNNSFFIENCINAGSVFIGNYSPESAGDYASGTNHTLPTNGYAKNYSGLNLDSFQKTISFQEVSKEGILNIGKAIEIMAEAEGLQAHKNAVSIRLSFLENN